MSKIDVAAVTIIGQKHVQRGVPCEDASMAVSTNGVSVVCVADGAGSKQYTHARFGSASVVKTICDLLTNHFDALYNENREAAVRSLIIASLHVDFANLLKEHELDSIEKLSCTLMFCAVKDRRMLVGHIGDGLIAKVTPSGVSPLTMPQNDKAGHTYFVTAPHAADYLRLVKTTIDDVHAIAIMTDGVQDMVYDDNSGLVKPVVAKMTETLSKGREQCESEIKSILETHIVGASNNSDDASFGILYFDDTSSPDASALPKSANAFPNSDDTFKNLQLEMVPAVKAAKEIIAEQMSKKSVTGEEVKEENEKKGEVEEAAPETKVIIPNLLEAARKKNKILYAIAIVECLIIVALVIAVLFL